jgi:hypothetical protein
MSSSATDVRHRPGAPAGAAPTDAGRTPPAGPGGGHGPFERVTVYLTARSSQALDDAARLTGETKTDTVNKALQVWSYLQAFDSAGGGMYLREAHSRKARSVRFR